MTFPLSDIRAALNKMRKVIVLQWAGNFVLALLAALWLQIPDSHLWQFVLSILSGLLIGLAALWLYAKTVSDLRTANTSVFLRMLLLILFAVLWLLFLHSIGLLREKEGLFAGFWNSKLSPHLRTFFDYPRLVAWQEHFYNLSQWVVAGLLLPIALQAIAIGVRLTNLKRSARAYRHWLYWIVIIVAGLAGSALASTLVGWTPGEGVALETVSLLARLGVVYTVDLILWCFVLALTSVYLEGEEV